MSLKGRESVFGVQKLVARSRRRFAAVDLSIMWSIAATIISALTLLYVTMIREDGANVRGRFDTVDDRLSRLGDAKDTLIDRVGALEGLLSSVTPGDGSANSQNGAPLGSSFVKDFSKHLDDTRHVGGQLESLEGRLEAMEDSRVTWATEDAALRQHYREAAQWPVQLQSLSSSISDVNSRVTGLDTRLSTTERSGTSDRDVQRLEDEQARLRKNVDDLLEDLKSLKEAVERGGQESERQWKTLQSSYKSLAEDVEEIRSAGVIQVMAGGTLEGEGLEVFGSPPDDSDSECQDGPLDGGVGSVERPRRIERDEEFTVSLRNARRSLKSIETSLCLTIAKDGSVSRVKPIRGGPPMGDIFGDLRSEIIRRLRFAPARRGRHAVAFQMKYPVEIRFD